MKKKLTIKDLAIALNTSPATISRALADSAEVSLKTRRSVQEYAQKIGFSFNISAKGLRTGKSNIIGIITDNIDNSFYSQLLEGIEEGLSRVCYRIMMMQSKGNTPTEKACLDMLHAYNIDGLIISPIGNSPNIDRIQQLIDGGFPIVMVDRIHNQVHAPKVGIRNQAITREAINKLIALGKKRIVYVTSRTSGVTAERLLGYQQSLRQNAIPLNRDFIIDVDLSDRYLHENLEERITRLYSRSEPPQAIFSAVDQLTNIMGTILAKPGLHAMDDGMLAGFSNLAVLDSFFPMIRIVQPAKEMGSIAVKLMTSLLNKRTIMENPNSKIELDATIMTSPIMDWQI